MSLELIRLGYHPGVVQVLEPWLLAKVLREHGTSFVHDSPHPQFGSSAQPSDAEARRLHGLYGCDTHPATVIAHPMNISLWAQPLQTTVADVEVKEPERVIPDELPLDLNTAMLDAGASQAVLDELTKEQIGKIMDAFEEGLSAEEAAERIGIRIGRRRVIVEDSQRSGPSQAATETETEADAESEEDDGWDRFR
jgi:hypothetical protein